MPKVISIPVIARELRVQARKPATYWARTGWGLAAGIFLAFVLWLNQAIITNGAYMFAVLHGSLATMLLFMAPIISADTISRERREGSLGLLLLTPLTPMQIVLGKFCSHFFRLLYFWLMMVPFLMMPMIIGGISVYEFLLSSVILLSIIMVGLAAGFVASSLSISFGAALVGSLILAALANQFITTFATNIPRLFINPGRFGYIPFSVQFFLFGPVFAFAPSVLLQFVQRIYTTRYISEILGSGMFGASLLWLWFAIRFAALRVAKHSQFAVETVRQQAFRRRFLSPLFAKTFFRRSLKRKLETNLFAWLEYRTPWSRIGIRIALMLLALLELGMIISHSSSRELFGFQIPLLLVLLFAIALKSANSFQYEKENGAFELLLVTPIQEHQLVAGRLRAVARYFLPIAAVLALSTILSFSWRNFTFPVHSVGVSVRVVSLWLSLVTVPAAGLFFSLRFKSFLTALCWTLIFAVVSGPFLWSCFETSLWYLGYKLAQQWAIDLEQFLQYHWWPAIVAIAIYHVALTGLFRHLAIKLLQRRAFADAKTA